MKKIDPSRTEAIDMVTRIEVEDAIKAHVKVSKRVLSVAAVVGLVRSTFVVQDREEQPSWRFDSFTILPYDGRPGMEHLREMEVRTHWSCCFSYDDGHSQRLTRTVEFPVWYLTQDGWVEREQRKDRNHRRIIARLQWGDLKASIAKRARELEDLKNKYVDMVALAKEADETVDPEPEDEER